MGADFGISPVDDRSSTHAATNGPQCRVLTARPVEQNIWASMLEKYGKHLRFIANLAIDDANEATRSNQQCALTSNLITETCVASTRCKISFCRLHYAFAINSWLAPNQYYQSHSQRTGSHILARNICAAAWMINPVFPIEALTENPGILIQKLS